MKNLKSVISMNVKRIIENKCLKQSSVARRAGYSVQTFSNMLNGRKIVTDVDVLNIATALEVDANALFAIEESEGNKN